jgi:hypothetical protein
MDATRRSLYALTATMLLLVAMLAGCNRAPNDAKIAGDVVTKINSDVNVPTKQIAVTSNGGVVTLAGTVTSDMERAAAANDAAQVEGVKIVVNNLQVAPASAAAQPQMAEEQAPEEAPAPKPSARQRVARPASRRNTSSYNAPAPSAPAVTSTPTPAVASAPTPPPPTKPVTIPDGTTLSVRMIDSVDSGHNQPGDTFRATLDSPITVDDKVVVPQGAEITGRVAELKSAGHFTGKPEIALELSSLSMNGRKYSLQTDQYSREGSSRGKRTAATVGGGAAIGAIIGGIAGGGKGAAIGSVIGAGAGTGVQGATKAQQIHVPSEALLSFRLQGPLTVTPVSSVTRSHSSMPATDYNDASTQSDQPSSDDPNQPVLRRRPE